MNFQVSVLKVLASYPNGLAKHADVKRDLAILATSGSDWARYSKRLGAAFTSLDVFSTGMVQIFSFGWRLTAKGAIALEMMEEIARRSSTEAATSVQGVIVPEGILRPSVAAETAGLIAAPSNRRALFSVIEGGRNKAA